MDLEGKTVLCDWLTAQRNAFNEIHDNRMLERALNESFSRTHWLDSVPWQVSKIHVLASTASQLVLFPGFSSSIRSRHSSHNSEFFFIMFNANIAQLSTSQRLVILFWICSSMR